MRPATMASGMTLAEAKALDLRAYCEYSGELKPLDDLGRPPTPEVDEPTHCYSCGAATDFSATQARKGSRARCQDCVTVGRKARFAPFEQRARRGELDVHVNLMHAVEVIDEEGVLAAIAAGADVSHSRQLYASDRSFLPQRALYTADGLPVPETHPAQPTTPLKMVVFRMSDCMLDEAARMHLVRIAEVLIEHGAARAEALELYHMRYGTPEPDEDGTEPFVQLYRHLLA
mmetsp:Transcript_36041/g.67110  ORF Transcript_36041/g.67110 Transcript_36041/m.67110 type:complete len:231 (+) Transcript_36041:37-729(+)